MVDIHSHILWEIDDGSGSLEESIAMLQAARDSGRLAGNLVTKMQESMTTFPAAIGIAGEQARQALNQTIPVRTVRMIGPALRAEHLRPTSWPPF
jgi:tyrosine-protein phosphatase YwqE